jgi:hypothetical protein
LYPENCVKREQYYIDLLKPEYNILPTAGSWLGNKHSDESRVKLAAARLGKTHSLETRAKIGVTMQEKIIRCLGKKEP